MIRSNGNRHPDYQAATLAAQGPPIESAGRQGLVPEVVLASTYHTQGATAIYGRDQNPTYPPVEAQIAALEGGTEALLFASGMAAAAAVFESLEVGARVVASKKMYWGLRAWLERFAARRGIVVAWVSEPADLASWQLLLKDRAALVWIETPANPTLELTDIGAVSQYAQGAGARVVVDNTVATPVLTRPLELGADLVLHSASKSLNGHSDVIAGVLVARDASELLSACRVERQQRGAILGPFEVWLLQRGLRTLVLRVERACANALTVAQFLEQHSAVSHVYYPGLLSHPENELARRQMRQGFGSLLSFRVRGGEAHARRVCEQTKLITCATSLGGVETLIEHRARIEGEQSDLPQELLRLSVGIEAEEDIVRDLEAALESW